MVRGDRAMTFSWDTHRRIVLDDAVGLQTGLGTVLEVVGILVFVRLFPALIDIERRCDWTRGRVDSVMGPMRPNQHLRRWEGIALLWVNSHPNKGSWLIELTPARRYPYPGEKVFLLSLGR